MKKYNKVIRYGKQGTQSAIEGNIVITEKLDGANASFGNVNGELKCFSRNRELDEKNNLRGFYQWVHENIDVNSIKEGYLYFGEWLVKHTINYPDDAYGKFYLFDICSGDSEEYRGIEVIKVAQRFLGCELAPILYDGEFKSLEHIQSFVGKSKIGDVGEGVVVKNYSHRNLFGEQVFVKFVSDEFAEIKQTKKHKVVSPSNELDNFIDTYLTNARVEKMINKLVDDGIISEDYDLTDMSTILRNSGSKVADDILEEELDSLIKIVKSKIGKRYPRIVRELVSKTNHKT